MSLYKNKTLLFFGTAVFVLLIVAYAVFTQVNFLGDMVLRQIEKAVNEQLKAEVSISPFKGNPIAGLEGEGLIISRSGDVLLRADKIGIDISLSSLLTGSPRVGRLVIGGLRSDYDSLMALLPQERESVGPSDIPINRIVINKSVLETPWGQLVLDDSAVRPKSTEWFALNLKGTLTEIPVAVSGVVAKDGDNWMLDGLKVRLADGSATVKGSAFPSPDLSLDMMDVSLAEVANIIPNLSSVMIKGGVSGTMSVVGLGGDMKVKGEGTLKDALIVGVPLDEVNAGWSYSKKFIELQIDKGNVFKTSLTGKFKLDRRGDVPYLELAAKVKDLNFSDWTDKIKDGRGVSYAENVRGLITSLDVNLKGPTNALTGSVNMASSSIRYKSMEINDIKGVALFTGTPAGDVNFSALYKNNNMTLIGKLSFAKDVASNLRFNADSFALDEISSMIPGMENYPLTGAVGISAALTGIFGDWIARGEVTSSQITEARYGTFKSVRLMPEYRFRDGLLSFSRAMAEWNGAQIEASGALRPKTPLVLDFNGTVSNAVLKNFKSLLPVINTLKIDASLSGKWSIGGTISAPTAMAELFSSKGSLYGLTFDKVSGKLNYTPEKLTLAPLDFIIGDGGANLSVETLFPRDTSGAYLPAIWRVNGKLTNLTGSALGDLLGTEKFAGKVSGEVKAGNSSGQLAWELDMQGKNVSWREFRSDAVKGKIHGDASVISIDNLRITFLRGENLLNGKITLAGAGEPATEGMLDLTVETSRLNVYELLRKHLPAVRGFQGLINGSVKISGTLGEPLISGAGSIAPLRYRSFLLPMVDLEFGGTLQEIKATASARLMAGTLKADARAWTNDGEWNAEASVNGDKINLRQIGRYLPEDFRGKLAGEADFTLKGDGKISAFSGTGTFSSRKMRIWGVDVTDVNAPFYISGGYAIMEDVKARSSGGEVTGGIAVDIGNNRWGGNLTVLSADVATFMSQSVPQIKGKITGNGDFKIRVGGELGRLSTVRASGVLRLRDGSLSEFKAVEAAQKFTRGNPLRFDTVQATFSYDGGFLTLLPGSQAIAPKNDPVYRYVMLDGTVDENGVLGLFAMGKANIQALNALLGAIQGLMDLDINLNEELDKGALLQGLIGGALSGFSRSDFRFATMGIRGTYDAPRFENIQVQSSKQSASDAIPRTSSDPKDDAFSSENTTFRFRFEIPVGPGTPMSRNSLDSQARSQVLKNALDSLLKKNDF